MPPPDGDQDSWMTQIEYARHANVNPSTVCRWLKNGRIVAEADGRIDPVRADRLRGATESPLPHHQARKAQFDAAKATQGQGEPRNGATGPHSAQPAATTHWHDDPEHLGNALKLETYRLQKAKAEAANLDLDRMAGRLVDRGDVEYLFADIGAHLRGKLDNMASQLASVVASRRGDVHAIHADLDSYARDLLDDLANHIERRGIEILGNADGADA